LDDFSIFCVIYTDDGAFLRSGGQLRALGVEFNGGEAGLVRLNLCGLLLVLKVDAHEAHVFVGAR